MFLELRVQGLPLLLGDFNFFAAIVSMAWSARLSVRRRPGSMLADGTVRLCGGS